MNPIFLLDSSLKTFTKKTGATQKLINHTLLLLEVFGIPVETMSPRRREKVAMAILALGDVKRLSDFKAVKDLEQGRFLTTRQVIKFHNQNFQEEISPGSYDDIRRKDLKLPVHADIVLRSDPNLATNAGTRGYGLSPIYAKLMAFSIQKGGWDRIQKELKGIEPISEKLKRKRQLKRYDVKMPSGKQLQFPESAHNLLQKEIIEKFLPLFGFGAEVLYVGTGKEKYLHLEEKRLEELGLPKPSHEELPDIIAYSPTKKWLYMIEAYNSTGEIDELRLLKLQKMVAGSGLSVVYVTAFLTRKDFRAKASTIAWETEVWIADNPDHLIHFNGDKFLGPYLG